MCVGELPMKIKLVVATGKHEGKVIRVQKAKYLFGRHEECDLQITSLKVSVHHARMRVRGDEVWLRDLDSKNGTFVNEERIADERQITSGDTIRIGPLVAKVQLSEGPLSPDEAKNITESEAAEVLLKAKVADALLGVDDSKYESTIMSRALPDLDPPKKPPGS